MPSLIPRNKEPDATLEEEVPRNKEPEVIIDEEEEVPRNKEPEVIELLDDDSSSDEEECDTRPAAVAVAVAAVTATTSTTPRAVDSISNNNVKGKDWVVPDPLRHRRESGNESTAIQNAVATTTTLDQGRQQVTDDSDHAITTTTTTTTQILVQNGTIKTSASATEPLHAEQTATGQAPGARESGVSEESEQTAAPIPTEGSSTVEAIKDIYPVHPKVSPDVFSSGETTRSIRTNNNAQSLHDQSSKSTSDTPHDVDPSLADEEELLLATIQNDIGTSTSIGKPKDTEPSSVAAERQTQDEATEAAAPVDDSYSEKLKRGASWNERVSKALFFNSSDPEDDDDEIMDDPMDSEDTPAECHEIPTIQPVTNAGAHNLHRETNHVSQSGSSTHTRVAAVHQTENYGHASQSASSTPRVAVTVPQTENYGHASQSASSSPPTPHFVAVHEAESYGRAEDLAPLLPKPTLDFLFSVGIKSIQELSSIDKHDLASKLLDSPGFKLGCALGAWKFDKSLNEMEMTRIAYNTVGVWKTELISWLGRNGRTAEASLQTHFEKLQERQRTKETPSLSSFLAKSDCSFLKLHCNIRTAKELVASDPKVIISNFKRDLIAQFNKPLNVKDGFVEGIVSSWILRAQEGLGPRETGYLGGQNGNPRRDNAGQQVETNTVDLCAPRVSLGTVHNDHSNTAAAAGSQQLALNMSLINQTQHLPAPQGRNHISGASIDHSSNDLASQNTRKYRVRAENHLRELREHIAKQSKKLQFQQQTQRNDLRAKCHAAPDQYDQRMMRLLQQKHENQVQEFNRKVEECRQQAKLKLKREAHIMKAKAAGHTSNHHHQQQRHHQQQVDAWHNPQPSSQFAHAFLPSQDQQSHQILMRPDRQSGSRAHENGSISAWTTPLTKQNGRRAPAKESSSVSPSKEKKFLCPLSYYTLLFLRFYGVHCDSELDEVDSTLLAKFYLDVWDESIKTVAAAERLVKDWKAKARKALGKETNADDFIPVQKSLKGHTDANDPPLMDSVHHLCHTTVDPHTGFPGRDITAYDVMNGASISLCLLLNS
eukprot:scaffold41913_cov54-Attheya_sp.AAC.6